MECNSQHDMFFIKLDPNKNLKSKPHQDSKRGIKIKPLAMNSPQKYWVCVRTTARNELSFRSSSDTTQDSKNLTGITILLRFESKTVEIS